MISGKRGEAGRLQLLTREFYARDTLTVARALLGQHIVRKLPDGARLVCRITETEAYIGPTPTAGGAPPAPRRCMPGRGRPISI